jgi:energy-coupling factor transporter ATP-binding protein EcfA2
MRVVNITGRFIVVSGRPGCGKSTLGRTMGPALGEADWAGFLEHLHPDGVVRGDEIRRFDADSGITSITAPGSAAAT